MNSRLDRMQFFDFYSKMTQKKAIPSCKNLLLWISRGAFSVPGAWCEALSRD